MKKLFLTLKGKIDLLGRFIKHTDEMQNNERCVMECKDDFLSFQFASFCVNIRQFSSFCVNIRYVASFCVDLRHFALVILNVK
jgi:hypothetical protein